MRMLLIRCIMALLLVVAARVLTASAQTGVQANANAALRYWMSFALLQDPSADATTRAAIEAVAEGRVPWDEARLGGLLDANADAISTMQRATELPVCDWGLEYALGPEAPIARLARARVLARLNALAGTRAMARGQVDEAVDTWIGGLRFAQHVPRGGTLLATLTGRVMLGATVAAIGRAVAGGVVDAAQRRRLRDVLAAVPETGFDWGAAVDLERVVLEAWTAQLSRDPAPAAVYERAVGAPLGPGISLPAGAAVTTFRAFMARSAAVLRLPPAQAAAQVEDLQRAVKTLHPFYQPLIPSLARINESRAQVKAERERVMATLQ